MFHDKCMSNWYDEEKATITVNADSPSEPVIVNTAGDIVLLPFRVMIRMQTLYRVLLLSSVIVADVVQMVAVTFNTRWAEKTFKHKAIARKRNRNSICSCVVVRTVHLCLILGTFRVLLTAGIHTLWYLSSRYDILHSGKSHCQQI